MFIFFVTFLFVGCQLIALCVLAFDQFMVARYIIAVVAAILSVTLLVGILVQLTRFICKIVKSLHRNIVFPVASFFYKITRPLSKPFVKIGRRIFAEPLIKIDSFFSIRYETVTLGFDSFCEKRASFIFVSFHNFSSKKQRKNSKEKRKERMENSAKLIKKDIPSPSFSERKKQKT